MQLHHIWNPSIISKPHLNYGFVASKKYTTPRVLVEIGQDKSPAIIKQRNGLNLAKYKSEGYFGSDERDIMMQWGSGAFSNHEIIRNSFDYIRKHNMFSNQFLHPFKNFDFTILRITHLDQLITYWLNPQSNGVAIQKSNTYTYRTKDYSLYTVQNYFPGSYADQQHIAGISLGNLFGVFHTHPALPDSVKSHSPSYWVGYGHLPHSVQDKNISLSIYNIPEKKNLMELDLLDYTHAYFPTELFDSVYITKNYAFGLKDSAFVALIGENNFHLAKDKTDDLIQKGKQTFWIIEAGSIEEDGSFEEFKNRIFSNRKEFNNETLVLKYESQNNKYALTFNGNFLVNKKIVNTSYKRFDSPYIKAKRKSEEMDFSFNNKFLHLNFNKNKREFN